MKTIIFEEDQMDHNAILHLKSCVLSVLNYKVPKDFSRNFDIWFHLNKRKNIHEICNFFETNKINNCFNNNSLPLYSYINNIITSSKNNSDNLCIYDKSINKLNIYLLIVISLLIVLVLCICIKKRKVAFSEINIISSHDDIIRPCS